MIVGKLYNRFKGINKICRNISLLNNSRNNLIPFTRFFSEVNGVDNDGMVGDSSEEGRMRKTGRKREVFEGDIVKNKPDSEIDVKPSPTKQTPKPNTAEKKQYKFEGRPVNFEQSEEHQFQTETRKILDIVTHSVYTDKEIFLRELISNSSDALENARTQMLAGNLQNPEDPFEINIYTNLKDNTLTIIDNGIGMGQSEMVNNLGTIARSGTRELLEKMNVEKSNTSFIGQFGVGFYSSFMVSSHVDVYSKSGILGENAHLWMSDGSGKYKICEADNVNRGTTIVLHLKEEEKKYSDPKIVKQLLLKYSNFLSYPIKLNGEVVNTVKALWLMDPKNIKQEQYNDFYKFVAKTWDTPMYHFHYNTDSPLSIKALFFVGKTQSEKLGMQRMQPGLALFSQRVLIKQQGANLLPDWLRFVAGAVDCEDLPLSISRETGQNSVLMDKLKQTLTKRVIKFFADELRSNRNKYIQFYNEYVQFLREGLCTDSLYKKDVSQLFMFESSFDNQLITLSEYSQRKTEGPLYYLYAPNRNAALTSPYYEAYKKRKVPVLFVYNNIDDYALNQLSEFMGRKIKSCEEYNQSIEQELDKFQEAQGDAPDQKAPSATDVVNNKSESTELQPTSSNVDLSKEESDDFMKWLKTTLQNKAKDVKISNRLVNSPAIITNDSGASVLRMMKMFDERQSQSAPPKETFEVNIKHPTIIKLNNKRLINARMGAMIAEQLYDNCLIEAGLLSDARPMMTRINEFLTDILK